MELIMIGIFTAFNLIVLKMKLEKGRVFDFVLDLTALFILNVMFGGTLGGMTIAMIASFIISFTLLIFPPKFPNRTY